MTQGSALKPLLDELARGTPKEKAKALSELQKIAETEPVRREFVVMGHAPKIVDFLVHGDAECRVRAASVIANITYNPASRATIIAAGALRPLVSMLSTTYSDFQEEAAGALQSVASAEQGQKAVIAAGAVPPLVELLWSSTSKGKARAAGTLGYISGHLPREKMKDILPGLVAMLSSGSEDASLAASCAIASIASTNFNRQAVVEAGALSPLLQLLLNGSLRVRWKAAVALGEISIEGEDMEPTGEPPPLFTKDIVQGGAVPSLVRLLYDGLGACGPDIPISDDVVTASAKTMSCLSMAQWSHPILVADGCVPALVTLLQEGKCCPMAKGFAASVLIQLAKDRQVKRQIVEAVPKVVESVAGQRFVAEHLKLYCDIIVET